MELEEDVINSDFSIEDLEQFRDKNGFIDLSKTNISFTKESREIRGNPDRIKNWIKFKDTKALIRGETILEEERNYGIYAELIVEEIAKLLGEESAHYDLIKIKDEKGNFIYGVLSVIIADMDKGEQLINLRDIIGDEPNDATEFLDATEFEFTVKRLREELLLNGYNKNEIEMLILDYKKRTAFTLTVLDTDKHTENIAFIKTEKDKQKKIKLSPMFDNEASLLLDNDISTIQALLNDYYILKQTVSITQPRIGKAKNIEDGGFESYWMDTLEEICEDDDVYDYCNEVLKPKLDMDLVLSNVEKRIKAPLPENVRLMAKYSYNCRNEEMTKILEGNVLEQEENKLDIDSMISFLINTGIEKEKIRTSEQLYIGKNIEGDMMYKELKIGNLINEMEK